MRGAHRASVEAARAMDESLRQLAQVAAARSAASRGANRGPGVVAALVDQLRSDINRRDVETFAARAPSIERRIATLRLEAVEIDPAARRRGGRRRGERGAGVRRRAHRRGRRVAQVLVPHARRAHRARGALVFQGDRERARREGPLARLPLLYAVALLIVIGYLGTRVIAAQARAARANEDLEKRVSERTRDLSQTLKRLKESEAQLVQTEKMSSLGQMVAGRRARDQHAARLREEQRRDGARPHARPARGA